MQDELHYLFPLEVNNTIHLLFDKRKKIYYPCDECIKSGGETNSTLIQSLFSYSVILGKCLRGTHLQTRLAHSHVDRVMCSKQIRDSACLSETFSLEAKEQKNL